MKKFCKYGHDVLLVGRDRWRQCRECVRNDSRKYRNSIYLNSDGTIFSNQDYLRLLGIQNHVCFICKQTEQNKRLSIDHNHTTNIVRGLLCSSCNLGIGNFKDNVANLKEAIQYLIK